jgi:dolichol-phosphate mannosyltransferase
MKPLVVLPTYNERENLESVVTQVMNEEGNWSVLVVDDNSPDGTGDVAEGLALRYPGRVHVLHRSGKLGLGSAYLEGFRHAIGRGFDPVCEMDADGSHDPSVLPKFLERVSKGAQVVIGSRRVAGGKIVGWKPHRHFMSRGAMELTKIALGLKTKDVTSGFRCYRADAVTMILEAPIESDGYAFQEEVLFHCEKWGLRIEEVPIVFRDRRRGSSKLSRKDIAEFFSVVWRLRRQR